MKHGLLVTFFGMLRDRFCTYQEPLSIVEKLERAARVPGVSGVELIYPEECCERPDLDVILKRLKLLPAAINVNIKGHHSFVSGALSSPDSTIRQRAVDTIQKAKEFASRVGCERVTCAPLADGYDYPFQVNYMSAWRRIVECLREAAESLPEVTLHLEHKPGDPRPVGFLDCSAKVLRLCGNIDRPGVGITFNVGHLLFGGGWPAAEFARVLDAGIPCYVHHDDGTVKWDWDLMAGSQDFWKLVEFLFYAKQSGYDGWFTADTFPIRQDAAEVFAANIRIIDRIWSWFASADWPAAQESIPRGDTARPLREITKWVSRPI